MQINRQTILEWASATKRAAQAAGLDPMPRDASFIRAALTFAALTRGPRPTMQLAVDQQMRLADQLGPGGIGRDGQGTVTDFDRLSAIMTLAMNIDDTPPSSPERARLFGEALP